MRTARSVVLGAAILALGASTTPVTAGVPPYGYGPHTAILGVHWILDSPGPNPELHAVRCTYTSGPQKLASLSIRQPVVFADVHNGPRTQKIGWRARIEWADLEAGPWSPYDATSWSTATATGKVPADLLPKAFAFPSNVDDHLYYRVVYQLRWYGANGSTVVDTAAHFPKWYSVALPTFAFSRADLCWSLQTPSAAAPSPPFGEGQHSGKRGAHWILDNPGPNPEYAAVTCDYDGLGHLERVRIRRPIIFARDTGHGVQSQDVAWKAVLQTTPTNSGGEIWTTVDSTSTTRSRATDRAWADLLPKSIEVGSLDDTVAVRIVYRLTWYKGGTSTVVGRASHFPLWYGTLYNTGVEGRHQKLCYSAVQ